MLSAEDINTYLEIATCAFLLVFDDIAEMLDISDTEMLRLRDQLEVYLNKEKSDGQ